MCMNNSVRTQLLISGYKTGRAVQENTNIGYVSNGKFVSVTVRAAALSATTATAENGDLVFTVPINLNPNSCDMEVWYE